MFGSAESVHPNLTRPNGEIISEDFQHMWWSQSNNVTEGQTDRQTVHRAVKMADQSRTSMARWAPVRKTRVLKSPGSSKVVNFVTNWKRVWRIGPQPWLITLPRFRQLSFCRPKTPFYMPTPISAKISGVPFGVDPWCWGLLRANNTPG